jgi:rRNA maturation endonuclease Nob1
MMILVLSVVLIVATTVLFTLGIRASDMPAPVPDSPTRHLEDRKLRVYESLRDLQFEYRVGKLSDDDYQRTKLELQRDLSIVMKEMGRFEQQDETHLACPRCGTRFTNLMKFCGECGKAMQ